MKVCHGYSRGQDVSGWWIALVLVVLSLVACSLTVEEVELQTKVSMQQVVTLYLPFQRHDIEVQRVDLQSREGGGYSGIASIRVGQFTQEVPVTVSVDGRQIRWRTPPGSWKFVEDHSNALEWSDDAVR